MFNITLLPILATCIYLTTTVSAQIALFRLSPGKMEQHGLLFSVQSRPTTNATQFTIVVSCTNWRTTLPQTYSATLRTEPEPASYETHPPGTLSDFETKSKRDVLSPPSAAATRTNSITYSFVVANDKLEDATFLFWMPSPNSQSQQDPKQQNPGFPHRIREVCCSIALQQFTPKK